MFSSSNLFSDPERKGNGKILDPAWDIELEPCIYWDTQQSIYYLNFLYSM